MYSDKFQSFPNRPLFLILGFLALLVYSGCAQSSVSVVDQSIEVGDQTSDGAVDENRAIQFSDSNNTTLDQTPGPQEKNDWPPENGRMDVDEWQQWPVVPQISPFAREVFQAGIEAGHDPRHFSILGDCQAPEWKLFGQLDWSSYRLPEEEVYLQPTVNYYRGQWERRTMTIIDGNTVATLFSVYWADEDFCQPGETPIDCEFRINNPNLVVLMLGTNWKSSPEEFEKPLRFAVEYVLDRDILPVLVTKADSHGEDWPLNTAIAQVANDYDIPLWNFWAAVQEMPNHGMDANDKLGIHILPQAYSIKRITGLKTLDAVLQAVYTAIPE